MAKHDFNGDGRSDIFWQNWDGPLSSWLATPSGDFIVNPRFSYANLDSNVSEIGDFNGDGFADVLLWGAVEGNYVLAGRADGSFVKNVLPYTPTGGWAPVQSGDFNGDGRADVLWVGGLGTERRLSAWFGNSDSNFTYGPVVQYAGVLPGSANVIAAGDTNGDGRDNVLWYDHVSRTVIDWSPTATGEFLPQNQSVLGVAAAGWNFYGSGDFYGDGLLDLLWIHEAGAVSIWSGTAAGIVVKDAGISSANWFVGGTGDYDGDGSDEILWQGPGGAIIKWDADATGQFIAIDLTARVLGGDAWIMAPW